MSVELWYVANGGLGAAETCHHVILSELMDSLVVKGSGTNWKGDVLTGGIGFYGFREPSGKSCITALSRMG